MTTRFLTLTVIIASAAGSLWAAKPDAPDKTDAVTKADLPIAAGPFQGTMDSLEQYRCPEWFRDAKFGIWSHWGPQAVPMEGDWYARNMYIQGSPQNKHHVERYGHPSKFGYKDIIPLWKAEKWDPDRLMSLYKKAGAKYFVSMASHHDNFHLWNSKHHKWNSVTMGPKRDVVADWQKAAKKQGLRFGVSEHLGASFWWFQTSHGADKTGPLAGVPYDGADPKYQDLYHPLADPNDKRHWYSVNPEWQRKWYACIADLIENYDLDLLYTDGGVPFANEVGLSMIADLYNNNLKTRDDRLEVVYNCKQKSEGRWVEDLERGVMGKINPYPWQTDTSIGDWYYNRHYRFRPVSWTIHMLADIVSKNGNLLLNIVQRPDGSLDPEVEEMLGQIGDWMAANGEAIHGTRPWLTFGEGPVKPKGGSFGENFTYTSKDIRFTAKGAALYAIALGWPDEGNINIRSLAKPEGENINNIAGVSLLGREGKLEWRQTAEGLIVALPKEQPCKFACTLKITGSDLKPVEIPEIVVPVQPDAEGSFILSAERASLHGDGLTVETIGGRQNIGTWDDPAGAVSWTVNFPAAGDYSVTGSFASAYGPSRLVVECADAALDVEIPQTKSWSDFQRINLGKLHIAKPGEAVLKVRSHTPATWKAVNLRAIKLVKLGGA